MILLIIPVLLVLAILIGMLMDKNYKGWTLVDRIQSLYWIYWQSPYPGHPGAVFKTTVLGILWVMVASIPLIIMCLI